MDEKLMLIFVGVAPDLSGSSCAAIRHRPVKGTVPLMHPTFEIQVDEEANERCS